MVTALQGYRYESGLIIATNCFNVIETNSFVSPCL